MASIDFDAVLDHLGAEGRYQTVLYYLLCIPATVPAAFLAFNQVFLSATPGHWCRVPELSNLTVDQRKAVAVPLENGKHSECSMYAVNFSQLLPEALLRGEWPANETLPVLPAPEWPVVACLHGWEYDTAQYDATLVTEVSSLSAGSQFERLSILLTAGPCVR